ncbi:hypothetical protein NECHADRAFT_85374, partial [Paecilomyces variotii No. 5]
RDGFMNFTDNYGDDPNYVGSSLRPTTFKTSSGVGTNRLSTLTEHEKWVGEVSSFASEMTSKDFEQATGLWKVLGRDAGHRDRFISNLSHNVAKVTSSDLRLKVYDLFSRVDKQLGDRLRSATEALRT